MPTYFCNRAHKHSSQEGATNCGYCLRRDTRINEHNRFIQDLRSGSNVRRYNGPVHNVVRCGHYDDNPLWAKAVLTTCGRWLTLATIRQPTQRNKFCAQCFKARKLPYVAYVWEGTAMTYNHFEALSLRHAAIAARRKYGEKLRCVVNRSDFVGYQQANKEQP